MTTLFAQSYLYRDTGFYFDSIEEFDAGMKRLNAKGIEEVEIQFIDGEDYEAKLFNAAGISQSNVYEWFEHLNDFNEYSATQITYLLELGYSLQEALDKHEDVYLYFGKACHTPKSLSKRQPQIFPNSWSITSITKHSPEIWR